MPRRLLILFVFAGAALATASVVRAAGDPTVAALQVALRREGVYGGPVDGINGAATAAALRTLQAEHGLAADGVAGPNTGRLLAGFSSRQLGVRVLQLGSFGWDVAELQFALAWHGFPSGPFESRFGTHLERAVKRFQKFAGLPVDGRAGSSTVLALRQPTPQPPIALAWPLVAPVGDTYGPRDARFHAGIDLVADAGAPVAAAAPGRVTWVGYRDGWGLLVTVAHAGNVRTFYAHLSTTAVRLGETVSAGAEIGRVGATGEATGPHLHFEVRFRGATLDPLPFLR